MPKKKIQRKRFQFATVDIESTGFRTTYGRILCIGTKFMEEDTVHMNKALNYTDEKDCLIAFGKLYAKMDVWITYNGKMFDFRFINGRRMMLGLTPLKPIKHVDLLWQAKKLAFTSAKLDFVAQNLGLENQKHHVMPYHWIRAANGNKKSLDLIAKHCAYDVVMTEELFHVLGPLLAVISR